MANTSSTASRTASTEAYVGASAAVPTSRDMRTPHRLSPDQWREFWMERLAVACRKEKLRESTITGFTDFIGKLLVDKRCHPRNIPVDTVTAFPSTLGGSEKRRVFCRNALLFFYTSVVPSEEHVRALGGRIATLGDRSREPRETSGEEKIPDDRNSTAEAPVAVVVPGREPGTAGKAPEPSVGAKDAAEFPQQFRDEVLARLTETLQLKGRRQPTIRNYARSVRDYLDFLKRPPGTDDTPRIEEYLLHLNLDKGHKPRTVNLAAAAITYLYREVVGCAKVVDKIPHMRPGMNLPNVYGEATIEQLIAPVMNPKHRLLLMIVYGCGLRLGELMKMRTEDIIWDRGVIEIHGKGAKERIVPLDPMIADAMKEYIGDVRTSRYVFEGQKPGHHYSKRSIQMIFENACASAGIRRKGGIHGLRHSYATHLHEQGYDIRQIQAVLGHASVKTTQIYTHVSNKEIAKIRSPLSRLNLKKGRRADPCGD